MNARIVLLVFLLSLWVAPARADVMFYGYNVYSPEVMRDDSESASMAYKMWYGGQESEGQQDVIFLRTSPTGAGSWSGSQIVMSTADIPLDCSPGCFAGAVNDPSITKHFNSALQSWEWTMFFTVAMCNDAITPGITNCNEQIWSSVSYDGGRSWQHYKIVTRGDGSNLRFTTTPSANWMGDHWKVYFAESGPNASLNVVHEMTVRWDRSVESYRVVYVAPTNFWTGNPEVKFSGDKAYLFFNSGSIYKVETTASSAQWGSLAPAQVVPVSSQYVEGAICAAITPSMLARPVGYDLFFATPLWSNGQCDVWHNAAIHKWQF